MKYLINNNNNPYYNLALEEYLLRYCSEDLLILWQNEPTIVLGRNQNVMAEVNKESTDRLNIHIARRETGGGAVYHDLGNVNFSILLCWNKESEYGFEEFLIPVTKALNKYGIQAYKSGRNDMLVDGKKVSGNAQTLIDNRLLHHGTLLVDTDLSLMPKILTVGKSKLKAKGVKSVSSRVANLQSFTKDKIDIELFKKAIAKEFIGDDFEQKIYYLSDEQEAEIQKLRLEKYENWDWIYGKSPIATISHTKRFSCGEIQLDVSIEKNIIKDLSLKGDFLSKTSVSTLEIFFKGLPYDKKIIEEEMKALNLKSYFPSLCNNDFLTLLF